MALSDYLQQVSGGVIVPTTNVYVEFVNNLSATAYIADAKTDPAGKYTFTTVPPPGTYSVYISPSLVAAVNSTDPIVQLAGGWNATGDGAYNIGTSPITTRGDLVDGGVSGVPQRLAIGATGNFLRSNGTDPSWQPVAESDVTNLTTDLAAKLTNPITTRGDLIDGGVAGAPQRLAVGSSGSFLRSNGTDPSWQSIAESDVTNLTTDLAAKLTNPITTRGDLIDGGTSGVPQRLAIGTSGKFLRTNGTDPSWQTIAESDVTNLVSDLAAKAIVDVTAGDYQAIGPSYVAGSTGKAADAGTVFAHGSGYSPNAHHNQAHSDSDHTGANSVGVGTATAAGAAPTIISTRPILAIRQDSAIYPIVTDDSTNGAADLLLQMNTWSPEDHGLISWTQDPVSCNGTFLLTTAGTVYVMRLHVRKAVTVTNIIMHVTTGGATLTSGQCFAALCTSGLSVLSATADQSTPWQSTGLKTMALSVAQAVAAGDYLVALYYNGTTAPTFRAGASQVSINIGLSASTARWATADTGRTTAFPGTLAALALSTNGMFAALS